MTDLTDAELNELWHAPFCAPSEQVEALIAEVRRWRHFPQAWVAYQVAAEVWKEVEIERAKPARPQSEE